MRRPALAPRLLLAAVLAAVLAVGVGCGGPAAPPARPAPVPSAPATSRITRVPDANTAAILLMSHNVVLAAARLAATRAQNRDVKLLARNLVTDHTTMSANLTRLLASVEITPRDDDVTRLLREQSAARRDTLRSLSGWPFDSAYVENEVRYHQDLLVAIDRVFIPSVRNAPLREYVSQMRRPIADHLALAQQVRDAIMPRR
jgi:putative membrane protein